MNIWTLITPWVAQAFRDLLRSVVGPFLMGHGVLNGSNEEKFFGAMVTIAGILWGWWTTSGYKQASLLLQKLTASSSHTEAVEKAEAMPHASPIAVNNAIINNVTGKVVTALLIAFVLSAFLPVHSAMAQRRPALTGNLGADLKANFEKTTGVKATGDVPFDLLKALDKALLPDLQYAQKLAVATGSKVTAPCYQAWIDMIKTQQTAVTDPPIPPATEGAPTPEPDPDLVTKFERMVELRNALQPDSAFMTACSPVANMVKMDVTAFMGIVISGGAGLATLVPGL